MLEAVARHKVEKVLFNAESYGTTHNHGTVLLRQIRCRVSSGVLQNAVCLLGHSSRTS